MFVCFFLYAVRILDEIFRRKMWRFQRNVATRFMDKIQSGHEINRDFTFKKMHLIWTNENISANERIQYSIVQFYRQ